MDKFNATTKIFRTNDDLINRRINISQFIEIVDQCFDDFEIYTIRQSKEPINSHKSEGGKRKK